MPMINRRQRVYSSEATPIRLGGLNKGLVLPTTYARLPTISERYGYGESSDLRSSTVFERERMRLRDLQYNYICKGAGTAFPP
ncbi:uncharacterized protein FFB20_15591 [Fusarium fujikuroi]|nr:uncharacterized protein FFE2_03758 [Fusarium fujikuroi]SCN95547.1 uncharacterized protein FFC1_07340 [Fusarium fujikuroi]SCO18948.1 uncharacterized protein FFB20_15591 [Fusarium fujikuroi]SCO38884.1 uncharacterized protein FFNC_06343 [Fusarium fujikuroi]SCV25926.1 uncharacterized protein FFB14_00810 [Fusarium fujikuroi]